MGGGAEDTLSSEGELSSAEQYSPQSLPSLVSRKAVEETAIQDGELMGGTDGEQNCVFSQTQEKWRRAYREVLKCYDDLQERTEVLAQLKTKIRSAQRIRIIKHAKLIANVWMIPSEKDGKPDEGTWVEEVGGSRSSDYQVPQTTCVLLIGPKGPGKSSLVNKISRVFEDDKFAPERAQISSHSRRGGDGTCFLREYMIPRDSNGFCVYDTRGLSDYDPDNADKIKLWMKKGVRHGQLLSRKSDDPLVRKRMKSKARRNPNQPFIRRTVNSVVFVVDGLSVLKSIDGTESEEIDLITRSYNLSYLSFNDDKPVVVVTHGDLLSVDERARVRVHLGVLLGIHPAKQIFDIPDSSDQVTKLTILKMLRYSLEQADRNLPRKTNKVGTYEKLSMIRVTRVWMLKALCFCLLGIAVAFFLAHHQTRITQPEVHDQPQAANAVHQDPPETSHYDQSQKAHRFADSVPKGAHKVACDRSEKDREEHEQPQTSHYDRPWAHRFADFRPKKAFKDGPWASRPRRGRLEKELKIDWSKTRYVW